jgi:hypothetical protein
VRRSHRYHARRPDTLLKEKDDEASRTCRRADFPERRRFRRRNVDVGVAPAHPRRSLHPCGPAVDTHLEVVSGQSWNRTAAIVEHPSVNDDARDVDAFDELRRLLGHDPGAGDQYGDRRGGNAGHGYYLFSSGYG